MTGEGEGYDRRLGAAQSSAGSANGMATWHAARHRGWFDEVEGTLWMMVLVLETSGLLGVECWEIAPYP
jgi:hypothetical protein